MKADLAASIHARLLNRARERGEDFNLTLTRYGIERFLYRLSTLSAAREGMWLKGALLFDLWFDAPHRPTRDADFLGFGPMDADTLARTMREICAVQVEDGMAYDARSMSLKEIREEARYGGLRVRLIGMLGKARCTVQLDVGYGDAVTPGPEEVLYPTLLDDLPAPRLHAYPRATVVAEKLEAIISLGMANSRMKDYYDLHALAREGALEDALLAQAIVATCERRGTPLPDGMPLGLTDEFAQDSVKLAQWKAFLGKNRLVAKNLADVVNDLGGFLKEPLRLARERSVA